MSDNKLLLLQIVEARRRHERDAELAAMPFEEFFDEVRKTVLMNLAAAELRTGVGVTPEEREQFESLAYELYYGDCDGWPMRVTINPFKQRVDTLCAMLFGLLQAREVSRPQPGACDSPTEALPAEAVGYHPARPEDAAEPSEH
jgi:hypothetical protein